MLAALSAGPEPPEALARLARGRVRATQSELTQALDGVVGEHHRLLLRQMLAHLADLERRVAELDACIQGRLAPLAAAVARVQTIPGIKAVAAAAILAEIGTDMSPFPTDAHLASWAGLCPGNHESAGKRKSGRTRPGNRWLRAAMTEAAWATARTKSTALRAAYDRIARRRGRKRALLALAHRLLVVVYHVLNNGCTYTEFGAHYLDRRRHEAHTRYFLRRLRELGYEATLRPLDAPPPVAA